MSFLTELKRRNVIRMAGLYLVGAWLLVQVAGTVLPMFGAPDWLPRSVVILLALGFLPALIFSWVFEMTPAGLKRDEEVAPEQSIAPQTARRMNRMIIGVLVLALAYFGFDKFILAPKREAALIATTTQTLAKQAKTQIQKSDNNKSIAVLPFTNMSEDKDSGFFADGIHEDILTNLALIRELRVVSRASVMSYRTTTKPMRQIAEELGVAYILEGSVRRSGNKVRVTGQLIHAATDEHVWAKAYDRDLTDVFAIQSEVSQQIGAALKTALSPEEKKLIESRPTENLAAYDAYAKARQILSSGTQMGFNNLEPLLKTAVLLDPKFAQAWAELGSVYARRYFDYWDHTPECLANAKAAIDKAMGLAPEDPAVIQKLGDYYYYGLRDYARAAQQYQRLTERYPNSAPAFASLAFIHRRQGRWSEALGELRRAVQLEPRNLRYLSALGETLVDLRLYDEAEVLQREIVAQAPDSLRHKFTLALIPYHARGSLQELEAAFREFDAGTNKPAPAGLYRGRLGLLKGELEPALSNMRRELEKNKAGEADWRNEVDYAELLWLHGDKAEARMLVEKVVARGRAEAESKPSPGIWVALSTAYSVLDDKAEALRCAQAARDLVPESADATEGVEYSKNYSVVLARFGEMDRALAELTRLLRTPGGANVHILRRDLRWRPLQGDPRFEALLNDPANNAPLVP